MRLHFATDTVSIEESDLNILFVGFYTEENYLMIQQSLGEYDEQDIRQGMNTYHIERDDQSYSGYGGVGQMLLTRNRLEVALDDTGKENLQCDEVTIDFQTDDKNYQLLMEKLAQIFGSSLVVR